MKKIYQFAILALVTVMTATSFGATVSEMKYEPRTLEEVQSAIKNNPADHFLIIEFGADWCGWCHRLAAWLDESISLDQVSVLKVDQERSAEATLTYNGSLPSWMIVKGDQILANTRGAWGGEKFGRESQGIRGLLNHHGVPLKN